MQSEVVKVTPEQLAAEIEKRNKQFAAANAAGKRVLIAKDVLKQIKLERIVPVRGTFLELPSIGAEGEDDIRDAFLSQQLPDCQACAVGALMIGCTLYTDKQKFNDAWNEDIHLAIKYDERLSNGLNEYFERDQLILIEHAFERGNGAFSKYDLPGNSDAEDSDYKKAVAFGRQFADTTDRLVAILSNIVKNKGTFKP